MEGRTGGTSGAAFAELGSTTYHRVHQAMVADIVNGTFAPGTRLKIAELCKRYGLSAMPIREALQQLQGEGLVVMTPNKGASVRPVDCSFITDIYDIRSALYAIIYRDVIAGADAKFDQRLTGIQKRFDHLMKRGDIDGCRDQNNLLHAAIEERCRNKEVSRLMVRYTQLTQSLRDVFGFDLTRIEQISKEHWRIIDAITARQVTTAVREAQHHSARALANMVKRLQARPQGNKAKQGE